MPSTQPHTKSEPSPEIITSMKPVMERKNLGALLSRLGQSQETVPLAIPNPVNGQDFTPVIPDNAPPGTLLAVKYMDQRTLKTVARTYEIERTQDGKLVAKPLGSVSEKVKSVLEQEITGSDSLGDPRLTLSTIGIGDNIDSKSKAGTTFQKVDQATGGTYKPGTDYFTVAIAVPARLMRVSR